MMVSMELKLDIAIAILESLRGLKPPPRVMSLEEFKLFLGTKQNAKILAKHCKVGLKVFVNILTGYEREISLGTKAKILSGLGISVYG